MSKAMQSIVDTYVALNRPEALQELQAHRLKLIGSEHSGFDLFRQQIEDELAIIRAGLVKLTAPVVNPPPRPDKSKAVSFVFLRRSKLLLRLSCLLRSSFRQYIAEPFPGPAVAAPEAVKHY